MDAKKLNQLPNGTKVILKREDETAEGITQLIKAIGKYDTPYTYSKIKVTKITDDYGNESCWFKDMNRFSLIHHDFVYLPS